MKLRPDQLAAQLQKSLQSMYWVTGDETLLVQECCDLIRNKCRQQGFEERELFFVEGSFNWQQLQQADSNLSLFATRKIIELRLRTAKLDDDAKKALQSYLVAPNPDNVLLIISPRIETAAIKTKWLQSIEERGALIQVWPVDIGALPQWINTRLRQQGIQADKEAIALLADRVEGNLLAASQEIEKLAILLQSQPTDTPVALDARTVTQLVANNSRYNVFALVDATLAAKTQRALKILQGLANEGAEPLMILAMLGKELRSLIRMAAQLLMGKTVAVVMQSEHVWNNRQSIVSAALLRCDQALLENCLKQAQRVDLAVKGQLSSDPWRELVDLILILSGTTTALTTQTGVEYVAQKASYHRS